MPRRRNFQRTKQRKLCIFQMQAKVLNYTMKCSVHTKNARMQGAKEFVTYSDDFMDKLDIASAEFEFLQYKK